MKRFVIIFLLLVICIYSCSQPKRNTMCDSIDPKEAVLLNKLALKHGITYDFTFKKVAFYTGPGAGARKSKGDFLPICRAIDEDDEEPPSISISMKEVDVTGSTSVWGIC